MSEEWTKSDSEDLRKLTQKDTLGNGHHPSCRPADIELVYHCEQCGNNESAWKLREDVLRLLDHVEALEAENEKLKARLYRPTYDDWFKSQNFPAAYLYCECKEILQTHEQSRAHYERGCFGPKNNYWKKQEEEIRRLRKVVEAAKRIRITCVADYSSCENCENLEQALSELDGEGGK